jgi:hypothetical protein
MGYPPKKRQPAAIAPSAQASSPFMKCLPVRMCLSVIGRSIGRKREYGKFRADQGAEFTMYAVVLFAGSDDGIVVAFGVHSAGSLEDVLRAEMDAQLAALAAVLDEIDLSARDVDFVNVERFTIEHLHRSVLFIEHLFQYIIIILVNKNQVSQ